MNIVVLLTAALASSSAIHDDEISGPLPDPIGPASRGQLQCYVPVVATKTCDSIAAYARGPDGTINNIAIVLLAKSPVVTMETVSPVEVKGGRVCGKIHKQDIEEAKFVSDGRPVDPTLAARLRATVEGAEKDMFEHEICTAYIQDADGLLAKATMDGVAMQVPDLRVQWVSPNDGYKVGP